MVLWRQVEVSMQRKISLNRNKILAGNKSISDEDLNEYERLYYLYWDEQDRSVSQELTNLTNRIFHPGKAELLYQTIEKAMQLTSELSHDPEDQYACCADSLYEILHHVLRY